MNQRQRRLHLWLWVLTAAASAAVLAAGLMTRPSETAAADGAAGPGALP